MMYIKGFYIKQEKVFDIYIYIDSAYRSHVTSWYRKLGLTYLKAQENRSASLVTEFRRVALCY
jgi:hypothetical protein